MFKLKTHAEAEVEREELLKNPPPPYKVPQENLDKFAKQLIAGRWRSEPTEKVECCTITTKITKNKRFLHVWGLLERVKDCKCYYYKMPMSVLIAANEALPINYISLDGLYTKIDFFEEPMFKDFVGIIDAKIVIVALTQEIN